MNRDRPGRPRSRTTRSVLCHDCGVDVTKIGHYYMVTDEVWAATGLGPKDGQLCLTCLRRRLGRLLRLDDFRDDLPCNREGWRDFPGSDWRRAPYRKEILRAIAAG